MLSWPWDYTEWTVRASFCWNSSSKFLLEHGVPIEKNTRFIIGGLLQRSSLHLILEQPPSNYEVNLQRQKPNFFIWYIIRNKFPHWQFLISCQNCYSKNLLEPFYQKLARTVLAKTCQNGSCYWFICSLVVPHCQFQLKLARTVLANTCQNCSRKNLPELSIQYNPVSRPGTVLAILPNSKEAVSPSTHDSNAGTVGPTESRSIVFL